MNRVLTGFTAAVLAAGAVTLAPDPPAALAADAAPIGFAAVNALGQNGTTGGAGGRTVTVATTDQLLDAIDSTERLVIQVQGRIAITSKQGVRPNKTIVGLGSTAEITGGGLDFYRSYNVIVRNILFTDAEDDAVNVGRESHHIWIDHNTFRGAVDGSVDIVRGADYVTVSWNHFDHADKSMLISHSDGASGTDVGHLRVTIHSTGGYADSGQGRAVARNNVFVRSGPAELNGAVVEPRTFYAYPVTDPATVPAAVRAGAGAGRL
jgi:pectate lyase